MNRTETRFAHRLELLRRAGEIRAWAFEPAGFHVVLGRASTYRPDFLVWERDRSTTIYEVKAVWHQRGKRSRVGYREDARVKIRWAAQTCPWWRFRVAAWDAKAKAWRFEDIEPGRNKVVPEAEA